MTVIRVTVLVTVTITVAVTVRHTGSFLARLATGTRWAAATRDQRTYA